MKALSSLFAPLLLLGCSTMQAPQPTVTSAAFGVAKNGQPATLWTLRCGELEIDVTDFGATLVAVRAPDRAGFARDIVLGFDDVAGYESDDNQYFGSTIGRVANRIANASFELDGYTYNLAANEGPHHLHGGSERSLDKVHWSGTVVDAGAEPAVRFSYLSRNGEEGYPGNLQIHATYRLLRGGQLRLDFQATTDQRTPISLTNHAYWNLAGAGHTSGELLAHTLQVNAELYTPTDDSLIPTGERLPVAGTALDFRRPVALGLRIGELDETAAQGYDHNLVLQPAKGLRNVAALRHQGSGRQLTIATTEPGLQVYSGNHLRGQTGKQGRSYARRSGICLEPQQFPNSINQAGFPSIVLEPGQTWRSITVWSFRAE